MWLFIVFSCSLLNNYDCTVKKTVWPTELACGQRSTRFAANLEKVKPRANVIYYCQAATLAEEQTP